MKPSENDKKMDDLRKKIIGLGETSHRKSYYPQLKKQINELSRAMHALQEKETKLQSFIDNVPVGMFQMSSEGRVILTNPKMAHILGQDTPEQAVSYLRNIQEQIFVDPKSNEKIKTLLEKQGYVENFECEILRADARSIWVLINAKVSNELKAGAFIVDGFVHDITERKRAEEMLKQTEMKYRQAYNLLQGIMESPEDIAIFALDREYRYLAFNKNHQSMMEKIWGVRIKAGTSILSYLKDPAISEKAKVNFDRVLAGEEFTLIEEYGDPALNGGWYANTYSPLKDDEGNIIGLNLILTDITERKRAEIKIAEEAVRRRVLIEQSSDGIVILDRNGKVFEANQKYADMLGYSPEEVLKLHI